MEENPILKAFQMKDKAENLSPIKKVETQSPL